MVTLLRAEIKFYIKTHHKHIAAEVIDEFEVIANSDLTINLARIDLNGIRGIQTNNLELAMEKYKHWSCEWVYIKDHTVKMIKNGKI